MGLRVWLDDAKEMPDGYNVWIKNAHKMADLIDAGNVSHISFDYDLGSDSLTGYSVALYIEQLAYYHQINPITWEIHTSNAVGKKAIKETMESAEYYWQLLMK
jgi:hypothetical protein